MAVEARFDSRVTEKSDRAKGQLHHGHIQLDRNHSSKPTVKYFPGDKLSDREDMETLQLFSLEVPQGLTS